MSISLSFLQSSSWLDTSQSSLIDSALSLLDTSSVGSSSSAVGVGEEGVGENDPVQENGETVHEIEDEAGTEKDNESAHKSVHVDNPSIESVETIDGEKEEPSAIYDELIYKQ